ncbi:ATP-dependent RNA helicase TDRD9-like [Paramacrobiotus metropolitanus]|uniref:ATP-dependent RNA helicase TDRD9-like n=1 Tax=Paramacrobiotus metropolitanus TaxID=2943436 RepID=UPI00244619B5|nr:ATP-dependent RNA helicase TDRD9-like [Paramacrobiotus metropolitanus]XP_055329336.1 ATP-dependent RNA helicase TDRD9-like [Paramacrobiotus metropolitanus]
MSSVCEVDEEFLYDILPVSASSPNGFPCTESESMPRELPGSNDDLLEIILPSSSPADPYTAPLTEHTSEELPGGKKELLEVTLPSALSADPYIVPFTKDTPGEHPGGNNELLEGYGLPTSSSADPYRAPVNEYTPDELPSSSPSELDGECVAEVEEELEYCESEITVTETLVDQEISGREVEIVQENVPIQNDDGNQGFPDGQTIKAEPEMVDETVRPVNRAAQPKPPRRLRIPDSFKVFPVWRHRRQILDNVCLNPVTLISGPTGSGKSALIPLLLDTDAKQGEKPNIVVAMPRRIAAMSLCNYVCQELDCRQGSEVGFQIGMARSMMSSRTRILYCTTGVLLQKMMHESLNQSRPLEKYTHLILDEVHERSEDIDFTMLLVKLAHISGEWFPKVIIMSATMNSSAILNYFKNETLCVCPPLIKIVDAPLYPVKEVYLEDMCAEVGCSMEGSYFDHEKPFAKNEIMNLVLSHIDEMYNRNFGGGNAKGTTTLVFLPGLEDIEKLMDKIHMDFPNRLRGAPQWEICPLHSLIPHHIQSAVFQPVKRNVRRIVLASNIAESSITVPEVDTVYDFCLTKNMTTDEETKLSFLQSQWATKSNCGQRKGRAGRTRNGTVYRLVFQNFYNQLADHPKPEILNIPVTTSILRSKMLNLDQLDMDPEELMGMMLSPPTSVDVRRAVQILKEKGALNLYHKGQLKESDGDLTFLGHLCATIPLSIPLVRLVFLAFCYGLLDDGIVLACVISVQSIFQTTWMDDTEGWISKKKNDRGFRSDCLSSFRIFREWIWLSVSGQFGEGDSSDRERIWCMQNRLSRSRLQEILYIVSEIRRRLSRLGLYMINDEYFRTEFRPDVEWEILIKVVIAGAFYPDYMISSPHIDDTTTMDSIAAASEKQRERFGGFDPLHCVEIAVPARADTLASLFYESLLRQYLKSILYTNVLFSIKYFKNRAVVCLERGVEDVTGQGALLVEHLLRSTKKQKRRNWDTVHKIPTVKDSSVNNFAVINPELAKAIKGSNKWLSVDYTLWYPELPPCPVLSSWTDDLKLNATVTAKVDDNVFFARLYPSGPDPVNQLNQDLQALLGSDLVRKCLPSDKDQALLGSYVISYMGHPSEDLARAKVVRIDKDMIEVYLVDYGRMARLPWNRTFLVLKSNATKCFWQTPQLAVKCRLSESFSVRPLSNISVYDRLQSETSQLEFGVWYSAKDTVMLNGICALTENSLTGRCSLLARMFDEGLLVFEHDLVEFAWPDVESHAIAAVKVKPQYSEEMPMTFGNPVNSYDIGRGSYRWLYKIPRFVEPHRESVNTVLLRSVYPDPVDYVLVSTETVVSKRKNMVVCADTTLMPHVPGISALLMALNAPVVEMRDDPDTRNILGFYCGLGSICRNTNQPANPIFAAHDFIFFGDAVLKRPDMDLVKSIRKVVNALLCFAADMKLSNGNPSTEMVEKLKNFQGSLRSSTLLLMQIPRRMSVIPLKNRQPAVCPPRWLSTLPASERSDDRSNIHRIYYES